MNKRLLIIFGCLIAVIVLVVIIVLTQVNKKSNVGEIVLRTNGGIPYVWNYTIEDESVVKYKELVTDNKEPKYNGGKVDEHHYFEGIKEGSTTIKFEFKDIRDDSVQKTQEYNVTVDNKLNITIKEIE